MIEKQKLKKTVIVTQLNCRGLNKKNRIFRYTGKNTSRHSLPQRNQFR